MEFAKTIISSKLISIDLIWYPKVKGIRIFLNKTPNPNTYSWKPCYGKIFDWVKYAS